MLLTCLLVPGCGGGGAQTSNAPFGPELVDGEYRYVILKEFEGDTEVSTGVVTPENGVLVPADVWRVRGGEVSTPAPSFVFDYDVLPDRTFLMVGGEWSGRITVDGMLATSISSTEGAVNSMMILARHRETPLLSSLAGSWKAVRLGRSGIPQYSSSASVSDATIDANGTMNYANVTLNVDGQIDPLPQVLQPVQFVLLANGMLAIQVAGAIAWRGGVSQDLNLILLAGNTSSGTPSLLALVRKGTAVPAHLVGEYRTTSMRLLTVRPQARWGWLTHPAPGTDATEQAFTLTDTGVSGPDEVTWGVGVLPDGELTLVLDAGPVNYIFRGALASSGAYGIVGGGISPTSTRLFTVLVR